MLRKLLTVATVLTAGLVLSACESTNNSTTMPTSAPSMGMLNDRCPISGEPVDPDTAVSYMGYKVGMCCAGCKGPWEKMSDDDKMAVVKKYTN